MKECKVEVVITTFDLFSFKTDKIESKIKNNIQEKIDQYLAQGYKLISTDSYMNTGTAVYTHLYFEK